MVSGETDAVLQLMLLLFLSSALLTLLYTLCYGGGAAAELPLLFS